MEIRFDKTGAERKALVTAISEVIEKKANYMGAPSFSYGVGGYIITRDGTLEAGGGEDISSLLAALAERGLFPAEAPALSCGTTEEFLESSNAVDMPNTMVIELPDDGFSDQVFENLTKLIAGKAVLIRKAVGDCLVESADSLPVKREDGKICFPWFRFGMEPNKVIAWSCFVGALYATAKKQKRVIMVDKPLEEGASEKYAMRCFLLKLGFIGAECKMVRKVILAGLPGDGSHKWNKKDDVPDVTDDLAEALADAELIHTINTSFEVNSGTVMDGHRDCLSCGHSMSEPDDDESGHDRLFCVEHEKYVNEDETCSAYNS